MEDKDFNKIISFITTYYCRKLTDNEILAIKGELKNITYKQFEESIKEPLLDRISFFTVVGLHNVINDINKSKFKANYEQRKYGNLDYLYANYNNMVKDKNEDDEEIEL